MVGLSLMKTPKDDLDQASRALVGTSKRDSDAPEASDSRTTMELIALYLRDPESDEGGRALGIVQYRGGKHESEIAERLRRAISRWSGESRRTSWHNWAGRTKPT